MRWVVTGGAGFIGSAFVRKALKESWAEELVVLDSLTYAGNLSNLDEVKNCPGFKFIKGSVCNESDVTEALKPGADAIFHFAAESHVDRSIKSSKIFTTTNVLGTQIIIDLARKFQVKRLVHISTDEVYGSLDLNTSKKFKETTPLNPTSPYAASKAASDLLVLAAHKTYDLDCIITRCSNNYGTHQFPEKFIPLFITNALKSTKLPLYGSGQNVRDWIHVDAHIKGIKLAYEKGCSGEVYNLGGECERTNLDIARTICNEVGIPQKNITFVTDRLSHDLRYAIDTTKSKTKLGFSPGPTIESKLGSLVHWYKKNTHRLISAKSRTN